MTITAIMTIFTSIFGSSTYFIKTGLLYPVGLSGDVGFDYG